ncbi:hypothetical protein J2T07_000440 [Luteibacter jiangsuensis]|uniref:ORC1/DEAH AAA+ ATPase domain-containing protein n=1 Tax=Luteibacter jiangsuensis TaxID=637577 RepID=A0ABT9STG1_9GAMM|nr:ATP-binding protein [Luteibacter jiangsuensis]MDQ0008281.1 hypothetical protein [Luteibacter jiangsuensis]
MIEIFCLKNVNMNSPDSSTSKTVEPTLPPTTAPAEGERRAIRGYTRQYGSAAAAIYHGLQRGDLRWVGLADRCAGIADDVVLGYDTEAIGHQFKSSRDPVAFRIGTLLTGANGLLPGLVLAWQELRASCPGLRIRLRLVVSDTPSDTDRFGEACGTTRQFVADWQEHPERTLAQWRTTPWSAFIDDLRIASGLPDGEFEGFFQHLELVHGDEPDFATRYGITDRTQAQVDRIAERLPNLVALVPERDRWSRAEFLQEMGWRDTEPRHRHQFPVGATVQRNPETEAQLQSVIRANVSGYASLVGPPGSGKSTLLQIALEAEPQLVVVRYLAFVPGDAQGIGRGESADFHEDLIAALRNTGLQGLRFRRESAHDRREELETLLWQAGERYQADGLRTLIIVDGLDHVPREERPERSFLADLPLPTSVPSGVLFVLGTQRVELSDIPPAVQEQARSPDRLVEMASLSPAAIAALADATGLLPSISRTRLRELSQGHPLATHYLLQALLAADDEDTRERILCDGFEYVGDIDALYRAALRGLDQEAEVLDILGLIARAEAPLDLRQLEGAYSAAAIERAFGRVRHLLRRSGEGWSVFHNSFRMFVTRLERIRYGVPDAEYSTRLYRQLVSVAEQSGPTSPQRFLVARYLMRAGAHQEALALATPAMLRAQYLEGRAPSAIRDDIRLAFRSLMAIVDPTAAFKLILASDEMARRSDAFDEPDDSLVALIALGELEAAEDFLDEVGGDGYLVVDAWLAQGNLDRARHLFERIEPLHDFGSQKHGSDPIYRRDEFADWVSRAVDFRSPSEIVAGVERFVVALRCEDRPIDDPDEVGLDLRRRAALAALRREPLADRDALITDYRLEPNDRTYFAVQAAHYLLLDPSTDHTEEAVFAIGEAVSDTVALSKVPRGYRRGAALQAARRGQLAAAKQLYKSLTAPAIAELNDVTDYEAGTYVARAVMDHAELATWLDESVPASTPPGRAVLRPLQQFATDVGALAAWTRRDPMGTPAGSAANLCADLMRYVGRAGTGGIDEHIGAQLLDRAAHALLRSILGSAARMGITELTATILAFDHALEQAPPQGGRHVPLQFLMAEALARLGQDPKEAERRLDALMILREEDTPSQFLASTARLANTYTRIGRTARARELLAQQRGQTLGYALRAKKDPQYAFWSELLQAANGADPAGRAQRVRVLTRQAIGMGSTEGRDAAHRLAHVLVIEAAAESAALGWSIGQALLDNGLIEFPAMIDALMKGTISRDPDRLSPCIDVWVALCLPFHRAPYYRENKEFDFLQQVIRTAATEQVATVRDRMIENIEIHALIDVRPDALRALRTALVARSEDLARVDAALQRLCSAPPIARTGGSTPSPYDREADMFSLAVRLDAEAQAGEIGHDASRAFHRLLPTTDFSSALALFDRHSKLQEYDRARFDLAKRALAEAQIDIARRLVADYPSRDDRGARWSWVWGGNLRHYFSVRLQLEGEGVHDIAYANFAAALVSGEEQVNSLLWDVETILPVLTASPDWVALWAAVEEQLPHTRDYRLGQDVLDGSICSDAQVAALLVERLVTMPVAELRWHAGRAALALAVSDPSAFETLLMVLLGHDDEDAILSGLQLARSVPGLEPNDALTARVLALAKHADFAVRILARRLAEQWGEVVPPVTAPMPAFYNLALPPVGSPSRIEVLRRHPFGPPLASDPAAWSAPFSALIASLAGIAGLNEDHVRRRVQQLIDGWGGVEAFGQPGIRRLEQTLSMLGLQMTYFFPHVLAGLRALRHIAGELAAAGRLPAIRDDELLREFHQAVQWTRTSVDARPDFVARPTLPRGYGNEDDWLDQVEHDLEEQVGKDTVFAEITQFKGHYSSMHYEWTRLRLFGVRIPDTGDPLDLAEGLSDEGTPMQRVTRVGLGALPRWELTLNPAFAAEMQWYTDDERTWLDSSGGVMATAYCWRDGGSDGDLHGQNLEGEGAAIVLTAAGRLQLDAVLGSTAQDVIARRQKKSGGQSSERIAHATRRTELEPGDETRMQ